MHRLAALSEDTTLAAFHILEQPKFSVFIAQHVLTLGQDYALVYLLLPTDQTYWQSPAVARLKTEREPTAQKSLLLLLWYAQTNVADDAIHNASSDSTRPAEVRSYARSLLERKAGPLQRAEAIVTSDESLRGKRRERLKAVSDEALIDLDSYTMMLVSQRH